jgi:hypothetical protein
MVQPVGATTAPHRRKSPPTRLDQFFGACPASTLIRRTLGDVEQFAKAKTGVKRSITVRLTCHLCRLTVFAVRCALAAKLIHCWFGWCATASQLLGRGISNTPTLEMFQAHGCLNLRLSCQFAFAIGLGQDRRKGRRNAPLYLYHAPYCCHALCASLSLRGLIQSMPRLASTTLDWLLAHPPIPRRSKGGSPTVAP